MMSKNEQENAVLADDQLENVTGGDAVINGCRFTGYVGKSGGVVGQKYFVVAGEMWFHGTLVEIKDTSAFFGMGKARHYVFQINLENGLPAEKRAEFTSGSVALFTSMSKD